MALFYHNQGEVQYFIGVQLDGSQHVEPLHNSIPEDKAKETAKLVYSYTNPLAFISLKFLIFFTLMSHSDMTDKQVLKNGHLV